MATVPDAILLGSVALEPNRWRTVDPSGAPTTRLSTWLHGIAAAGFDGVELWERHATDDPTEAAAILGGPLPITIWNTYADFDRDDPTERDQAAAWAARASSGAVKCNVGADASQLDAYAERLGRWVERLPDATVALCECHAGTVAEVPAVAAQLLDAAGPPERVQAIVHTHESPAHLAARFDAYGERIRHVHVNHLDPSTGGAPPLADVAAELRATVTRLRSLGFRGSWTIEFVHGTLTDQDHPAALLDQATRDLAVLREVLAEAAS